MITSSIELGISVKKNNQVIPDLSTIFKVAATEEKFQTIEIFPADSYEVDLTNLHNVSLLIITSVFNESITVGVNQVVEGTPSPVEILFNANSSEVYGFEALGLDKTVSTGNITLTNNHTDAKILVRIGIFCEA